MEFTKKHCSLAYDFSVVAMGIFFCFSGFAQTNGKNPAMPGAAINSKASIKTNFVKDGKLTDDEISQVLELAKRSGLTNAAEVSTFYFLPSSTKGVSVKSVDSVDDRNTRFDTIYINKTGWLGQPGLTAKRIGNFWVDAGGKRTTLLRSYELPNQQTNQVSIGEGVDVALADKIVSLFVADKLPYAPHKDEPTRFFIKKEFGDLKPKAIYKGDSEINYELRLDDYPITVLNLKFEKGEITVTSTSSIVI